MSTVTLETTLGNIVLELDEEKAPETVKNFLSYVNDGFFDGTIFHRVIDNFMIQGGGFNTDMGQKDGGDPIENEADNGLKNDFGTIAMARTTDPHSATAQFFINVKDNDFLNHSGKNMQ
jgi:peptidyl-prolyl cis-trans isomerase B (cyclophilin B)